MGPQTGLILFRSSKKSDNNRHKLNTILLIDQRNIKFRIFK